ncbi:MAG TPA: GNAT family N-acetyltransferase [Caulobacteraceae bacterium]|nr:GNAT family N-acetyltransferase [Caulobacteraceae bacterium]
MVSVENIRPQDLTAADRDAWRALCAATPALRSPLLGPDFAEAVGRRRSDAYVAVARRDGRAVGFLPHHRRPTGFARPIGATFSDYHALAGDPGAPLDGPELLAAAGLRTLRFSNLIDPFASFSAVAQTVDEGFAIHLGPDGAEAYLQNIRAANTKRAKNWRRLEHKLDREMGEVSLIVDDRSREAFETLIHWKRRQLIMTGRHDVLRPDWSLGLMRDLFEARGGPLEGLMMTLRAGGRVVAGHFGVRLGDHFHSWISAADPEAAAVGAGNTLMLRAIAALPEAGLSHFDMGPSHGHYKEPFCTSRVACAAGVANRAGAGSIGQIGPRALALAAGRSQAMARMLRRIDHIAATELSIGGRVRGVVEALCGHGRRPHTPAEA